MDNSRQQLKKQVKKHIPKDWLCELRIAYRIVMEAVNDIKRTGIINLVIITTMAAILTLFGVLFRFTLSLSTCFNCERSDKRYKACKNCYFENKRRVLE